jgi:hypothetical protein
MYENLRLLGAQRWNTDSSAGQVIAGNSDGAVTRCAETGRMTAFHHPVRRKPSLSAPVRPAHSTSAGHPAEPLDSASRGRLESPFGADFSRVRVHADTRGQLDLSPKRLSPAPVRRLPGPIQRKLVVGAVDDPLEHEGDRVADQVMRMPAPDAVTMAAPPQVSRMCNECQEEEELQRKQTELQAVGEAPASVHEALRWPGQPLDLESRAFFEPRFGKDFSQVRLHADARAAESAHAVHARAYTVGQHVVFGRGQYAPHTADGRRLLAHELVHTVQQQGGAAALRRAPPSGPPGPASPGLDNRLKVIEETGPATQSRLDQILRNGGPTPQTTKVVGAAIIDVEGYQGPREMRAISGADSDALGQGASVYHATSPANRTLSATRSIAGSGPRRDFPFSHINDAEMKLFEDIISRLPKGAKGTIHFSTMRVRQVKGQTVWEPYPACSGCIRAGFEAAGKLAGVDLVSHAPVHPTGGADLGEPPAGPGGGGKPPAQGGRTPAKPATPGGAAAAEPPQVKRPGAAKPATATDVEPPTAGGGGGAGPIPKPPGPAAPQPGRFARVGVAVGVGALSLGIGLLSSYLKQRADRKIAAAQIDRNQAKALQVINEQVETILKMMMTDPEKTLYARVYMSSAVITTFEANESPEPTMSDSSPIIDLTGVGFTFVKLDPDLADTFQGVSGGGRHITMVRLLISEIPLETPPIEDLIALAKVRKLPLDELRYYVISRLAGVDQKQEPQKFIAEVNHWKRILDLVEAAAARP